WTNTPRGTSGRLVSRIARPCSNRAGKRWKFAMLGKGFSTVFSNRHFQHKVQQSRQGKKREDVLKDVVPVCQGESGNLDNLLFSEIGTPVQIEKHFFQRVYHSISSQLRRPVVRGSEHRMEGYSRRVVEPRIERITTEQPDALFEGPRWRVLLLRVF